MKRRILAMLLAIAMIVPSVGTTATASANTTTSVEKTQQVVSGTAIQEAKNSETEETATVKPEQPESVQQNNTKDAKEAVTAFSAKQEVDDVIITVSADAGVFPEGATFKAKAITKKSKIKKIDQAVSQIRDKQQNVLDSRTYDITMYDEAGNEIQPDNAKGKVKVSFALKDSLANGEQVQIYHVPEVEDTLVAENVETKVKEKSDKMTVSAETTGFSAYVVEFTSGDLQYVLKGDSSIALSKILEKLNITGRVTKATFSNTDLVKITKDKDGDDWTVTAKQAFTSNETLELTVDGKDYVIAVTDAQSNTTLLRYKKSASAGWSSGATDPFNAFSGYLWVDNPTTSSVSVDLGEWHAGFNIGAGQKVIITSSGGGSVRVWNGGSGNTFYNSGTIYVGSRVTVEKSSSSASAIACGGGTVYMAGTCVNSSGKGLWTEGTTSLYLLSGSSVNTNTADKGGSWSTTYCYDLSISRGSGVYSASTSGYMSDPYEYEGKFTFTSGANAYVSASANTGYYISSGGNQYYSMTSSRTAYVYATEYSYPVYFYSNASGVSNMPGTQTKYYTSTLYLSSTKPTRSGYIFQGWNTNSSGTGSNYSPGQAYYSNSTLYLYAKWTPITYYVAYNRNGGEGAMATTTHVYDTAKVLSKNTFTKEGYEFQGWSTNANVTLPNYYGYANGTNGKYTDEYNVKNLTTSSGGTVNLYAVWRPIPHIKTSDAVIRYGTGVTYTYGDGEKYNVNYNGDGVLSATSSDTNVATVKVDTAKKTITMTPLTPGETTITLKTEETAYWCKQSQTFTLRVDASDLSNSKDITYFDEKTDDQYEAVILGEATYGKKIIAELYCRDNAVFNTEYDEDASSPNYGQQVNLGSKRSELDKSVVYSWYRVTDGREKCVGTGREYYCSSDDIGSKLRLKVTAFGDKYTGEAITTTENDIITTEPSFDPVFHYIYGNGVEIHVISDGAGGTKVIYDANNDGVYDPSEVVSSGNSEDGSIPANLSDWTIVGGYKNSTASGNNKVVMEGGSVKAIYGAGQAKPFTGNAEVIIKGGNVAEDVYGGSQSSSVKNPDKDTSNSQVTILDGVVNGSVYGGCYAGDMAGNTNVTLSGGEVKGMVYAGGNTTTTVEGSEEGKTAATVQGSSTLEVSGDLSKIAAVDISSISDKKVHMIGNLTTGKYLHLYAPYNAKDILKGNALIEGTVVATSDISSYLKSAVTNIQVWTKESEATGAKDVKALATGYHFAIDDVNVIATHKYSITLDKNSGAGGTNKVTLTYGESVETLSIEKLPERTNYQFDGYSANGVKYFDEKGKGIAGVNYNDLSIISLTADWLPIPVITTNPKDILVTAGNITEALTVTAKNGDTGVTGLTYQWYSCDADGSHEQKLTSEITASLTLSSTLKAGRKYFYYCIVGNDSEKVGSVQSEISQVTVQSAELLYKPTANQASGKYKEELSIELTSENAAAKIYYTIAEKNQPEDPDVSKVGEGTTKEYAAGSPIVVNAIGTTYIKAIVVKENCVDSAVATFSYTLLPSISMTEQPENIDALDTGVSGTMHAFAQDPLGNVAADDIDYQWYETDSTKGKITILSMEGNHTSDLAFTKDTAGVYYVFCRATVMIGDEKVTVDSNLASIMVIEKKTLSMPTANLTSGTYYSEKIVTLSQTNDAETYDDAEIYYTLDGSDPADEMNVSRTLYDAEGAGITINDDTTLKAVVKAMVDENAEYSNPVAYRYEIVQPELKAAKTYVEAETGNNITLSTNLIAPQGSTSYKWYQCQADGSYTEETDADDNDLITAGVSGRGSNSQLNVTAGDADTDTYYICTVNVITSDHVGGTAKSSVIHVRSLAAGAVFAPVSNVADGTVQAGTSIELSTVSEGTKIYYEMGDALADPDNNSTLYDDMAAIVLDTVGTTVIKAVTFDETQEEGSQYSAIATYTYQVLPTVSIETEPADLDDYTVDGRTLQVSAAAEPVADSSLTYQWYASDASKTRYEIATVGTGATTSSFTPDATLKGDYYYFCRVTNTVNGEKVSVDSRVACVTVADALVTRPVANVAGGIYYTAKKVTLSTTTEGNSIYYTLDGSDPVDNADAILYNDVPVEITSSTRLRAVAVNISELAVKTYSTVASYQYTIESTDVVVTPTEQEKKAGETADYTAKVEEQSGYTYSYQWLDDEGDVVSETKNLTTSDTLNKGNYTFTCKVTVSKPEDETAKEVICTSDAVSLTIYAKGMVNTPDYRVTEQANGDQVVTVTRGEADDTVTYQIGEEPAKTLAFESGSLTTTFTVNAEDTEVEKTVCLIGKKDGYDDSKAVSFGVTAVKPVISFLNQPESVKVESGYETAPSLSIEAKQTGILPAMEYQWYECKDAARTDATPIALATGSRYTFDMGKEAGNYYYYCKVSSKDNSDNVSAQLSQVACITVNPIGTVKPVVSSLLTGDYKENQTAELTCETEGASIYYTLDGSDPATSDTKQKYASPLAVTSDETLKAVGVLKNYKNSDISTYVYTIAALTITEQPGNIDVNEFHISDDVTIATNATINIPGNVYYQWYECDASGRVEGTILSTNKVLQIPTNLRAASDTENKDYYYICKIYSNADVFATASNIAKITVMPSVVNPEITVIPNENAGTNYVEEQDCYYDGVSITLASGTSGAEILYTLDGSDPSDEANAESIQTYTDAIQIPAATTADKEVTIKAYAKKGTSYPSGVVSQTMAMKQSKLSAVSQPEDVETEYSKISGSFSFEASDIRGNEVTYQWYSSEADKSNKEAITAATGSSMSIDTELNAGTYYYFCEADCAASTTEPVESNVVILTVKRTDLPDFKVSLMDWSYGNQPENVVVEGNLADGDLQTYYKKADADDSTYTQNIPEEVGNYIVKETVEAKGNYNAAEAFDTFTITATVASVDDGSGTVIYYKSIVDALDAANKKVPSKVDVIADTTADVDVSVASGVAVHIASGCAVSTAPTASITNEGIITNEGTLNARAENNGTIINHGLLAGTIQNNNCIESTEKTGLVGSEKLPCQITNSTDATISNIKIAANSGVTGGALIGPVMNEGTIDKVTASGEIISSATGIIRDSTMSAASVVSGGIFQGTVVNMNNISDAKIDDNSIILGGQVSGTIINNGFLTDVEVFEDTIINGGVINGTSKNNGTLNGVAVAGTLENSKGIVQGGSITKTAAVSGGVLTGEIENAGAIQNAVIEGKLSNATTAKVTDVTIANQAVVDGGTILGTIENSGIIQDATIDAEVNNGTINGGSVSKNGKVTNAVFQGDVVNKGKLSDITVEGKVDNVVGSSVTNLVITESGEVTGAKINGTIDNKGILRGLTILRGSSVDNHGTDGEMIDVIIEGDTTVSGGLLKGNITNDGTITDATIDENAMVSGGVLDGTIENNGTIKDLTISEDATIQGGSVEGIITNKGTLADVVVKENADVIGGALTGDIKNHGVVENVSLDKDSTITGGQLKGDMVNEGTITDGSFVDATVSGTGFFENATIDKNSAVSGGSFTGTTNNAGTIIVPEGETTTISGIMNNTGTIDGSGKLVNTTEINNAGGKLLVDTIDNQNGSILDGTIGKDTTVIGGELKGNITNEGTIKDANFVEATVTGNGSFENVTIDKDSVVSGESFSGETNNEGTIFIPEGTTTTVSGTLTNNGTIEGPGTLVNTGSINNADGLLDVDTIDNQNGSILDGTIGKDTTVIGGELKGDIANEGTIQDATIADGAVISGGSLTGDITNHGTAQDITVEKGSTMIGGTVTGNIKNEGTMIDVVFENAIVTGNGSFENAVIDKDSTVSGDSFSGATTNHGTILIPEGEKTTITGTMNNDGTIGGKGTLENTGELNNAGGTLSTSTIDNEKGTIQDGNFIGSTITGGGSLVNATIDKTSAVSGGSLSGVITNEGTVSAGTFTGATVSGAGAYVDASIDKDSTLNGGTIMGNTTNNGSIQNGTFAGAIVTGTGSYENATIDKDSVLSGSNFAGTTINQGTIRVPNGAVTTIEGAMTNAGTIDGGGKLVNTTIINNQGGTLNTSTIDNEKGTIKDGTIGSNATVTGGSLDGNITSYGIVERVTILRTTVFVNNGTVRNVNYSNASADMSQLTIYEQTNPKDVVYSINQTRKLTQVTLDGTKLDAKYYVVNTSTHKLNIKAAKLATLAKGNHKVVFTYSDGYSIAHTLQVMEFNPKTVVSAVPVFTMSKNIKKKKKFYLNLVGVSKNAKVTYKSSKKKVATVNKKGCITGKKKGKATITATIIQNGAYYKVNIKVKVVSKGKGYNLKKAALSKKSGDLPEFNVYKYVKAGKKTKLTISKISKKAKVTYKSSKKKVATVSKKGVIKGKKKGFAVITAKIKQNGKTFYYRIFTQVKGKGKLSVKKYLK